MAGSSGSEIGDFSRHPHVQEVSLELLADFQAQLGDAVDLSLRLEIEVRLSHVSWQEKVYALPDRINASSRH